MPLSDHVASPEVRKRRVTRAVLTGFVAKAASFFPTLLIARIMVPVLGTERYGVLMTTLSLLAFLAMADLGVGGGLVPAISRALGKGDLQRVRELQANGFVVVSGMAVVLLAAACALFGTDIGANVFSRNSLPIQLEATYALATFGV